MGEGPARPARGATPTPSTRHVASRPAPAAEVAEIYERYEREKRRRRLLDFDDLIWWCADALETDAEFAAVQRWRFRHLFVDEFQDTSPAQFRLVRAWLGDRTDLCVVGDPNQAIYGFAGADAGLLTRFRDHFPGARVVQLDRNYRSTPQIVARRDRAPRRRRSAPAPGRPGGRGRGPGAHGHRVRRRRRRGRRRRERAARRARRRPAVVVDGGAVPHQRAVGRVRGGAVGGRECRSACVARAGSSNDPR